MSRCLMEENIVSSANITWRQAGRARGEQALQCPRVAAEEKLSCFWYKLFLMSKALWAKMSKVYEWVTQVPLNQYLLHMVIYTRLSIIA